jgi:hypothetical protein
VVAVLEDGVVDPTVLPILRFEILVVAAAISVAVVVLFVKV